MKLAEQYEKPEFITDDPVQFPRRFGYKCSQEIVGFIAAWLAYGNRKAILSTCEKLCKEMERLTPYMYISTVKELYSYDGSHRLSRCADKPVPWSERYPPGFEVCL